LWQRAVVMNCVLLLPAAVLLWRYAEPLVVATFGAEYLPAAFILQCFTVVMVRECFDFSPPLRALNRNGSLVTSVALGLLINAVLLALLLPRWQLQGAIAAVVIASVLSGLNLARHVRTLYELTWREFLPWSSIAKVAACALAAALVLVPDWAGALGIVGVGMAALSYLAVFAVLLRVSGVSEANVLLERVWARLPARRARAGT
jgi:O-antigen/teichoic acid export membrane protein